jgi:DNA-binding MarR family transcriptional regulator
MATRVSSARSKRGALNVEVLRSFRVIYGSVRQHFRDVQQECGVSGSQLWLLQEIGRSKGLGVSELAQRLSIHQSTCSLLIEKLVRAGYVRKARDRGDLRRAVMALTARGRRTLVKAPGPAEGVLPDALASLPAPQLRSLLQGLNRVIAALEVRDEEAAAKPLSDL